MRIRSTKPEFWRSRHIAMLPWDLRLLFLGLWTYVDDNGVGLDDPWQIQSDLFPLEDDPLDARERVSRGLVTLSRVVHESSSTPLIIRYEADGKRYLSITGWKHQRIDRPSKERYPEPSEEDVTRAKSLAGQDPRGMLASPRANGASVTGEQGNRGTGETNSPTASILFAVPEPEPAPKAHGYPQVFEDAWLAYGRKGAKKTSNTEWQRAVKRASVSVIVAAIGPYVASTPDAKFRKDFERWLKGDGWESAVVPSRRPAVGGYQPFTNPTDPDAYDEELI